jgi:Xaa-Pro aminopeptidase
VRERDPEREVWDGLRAGVDGAKSVYGADEAYPIGKLPEVLPTLLTGVERLYYQLGHSQPFDEIVLKAIAQARRLAKQGKLYPTQIIDPATVLHDLRLRKDPGEIELMQTAARITCAAHCRAMAECKVGMHEYEIEAVLVSHFLKSGSARPAYGSIVGSGPNATVLHYHENNRQMADGDLLLIDAGCEFSYYASDVTRTFPVNGRFSAPQRAVYEIVLEAQYAAIDKARPGSTLDELHQAALSEIAKGLLRLGIISGTLEEALEKELFKPYFMHKTSHFLGMDVHDVGGYFVAGAPRALEAGMVITVEPGIYISERSEAALEYRGIGVRIEDDLLLTDAGHEVLTMDAPKTVADIERACA